MTTIGMSFNQMSSNPIEKEIEDGFITPLIKRLGYDKSEYCYQFKTGWGQSAC